MAALDSELFHPPLNRRRDFFRPCGCERILEGRQNRTRERLCRPVEKRRWRAL